MSPAAAGAWYTDRYAPAGFVSQQDFDGDMRLKHSIASADGTNNRPPAYSSTFYDTQGRKYDLAPDANSMEIELFIPADWETTDRRMAGFWGTAVDGNQMSFPAIPIIEFTSTTSDGPGSRA
ncbi:MAG: hypothetical protein IPJ40_08055 [Saprospirales bacterium]|nr:hypothetical protein [Saprospirales bacterium]